VKQVLQNMRTGQTTVEDVPSPGLTANGVLIRTTASLISAGTERMLVEFGKGSLLAKARSQPDKVKQVLDKIKTDGLIPTLEAVFTKLDEPLPLGYCNAGVVLEVGSNVKEFRPGDRVVSNGPHAEIVCVPKTLCAKIPEGVNDEQAAFTVLSSIALQGIRLLAPNLGERYVVYGLGLIGLIACQLLRAHGCDVLGVDLNPRRIAQAQAWGVAGVNPGEGADPVTAVETWTGGRGADDVIVCAPVASLAAEAAAVMAGDGMLVLFAGCPNGTLAPLDLSRVYLHNAQYTGTSGSTVADQALVIAKAGDGRLSPERSVAAIGGIEAAQEGVRALLEGRYPGKVVIFPQLTGLPLLGLAELEEALPSVAACLAPGSVWTREAERALIERFWQP